jgi:hypothetical protein
MQIQAPVNYQREGGERSMSERQQRRQQLLGRPAPAHSRIEERRVAPSNNPSRNRLEPSARDAQSPY